MFFNAISSIILYLFVAFTLYRCGIQAVRTPNNTNFQTIHNNRGFFLFVAFFTLMCAIRYNLGTDCESYVDRYEATLAGRTMSDGREQLFDFLTNLVCSIEGGRIVYLGLWAFLEIIFLTLSLKNRIFLLPYLGLALVLGQYFQSFNNILRQMTVACMFTYGISKVIEDKKFIFLYLILVVIGYYFHSSALVLLPFVLLYFYDFIPKRYVSISLILASFFLGQTTLFDVYIFQAEGLLNLLGYDNYTDKLDWYVDLEGNISNYGPRRLVCLFSYLMVAWFSEDMDKFYNHDNFFRVTFLGFMLFACGTEIFAYKSQIFLRPFTYLTPLSAIGIAYLLNYLKESKKTITLLIAITICCSFSIIASLAEYKNPEEHILYKTIITN